ncbi:MAG: cell envelope integrity protein CreD [Spirochaetia bacterium]|nr:cell envelope integrity protein CreD [Spirochaetia bacterium]
MLRLSIKLAIIGTLSLLLLIPTITICSLTKERKERRDEIVQKSGMIWGSTHALAGPVIILGSKKYFPTSLDIRASVNAEVRHRGIFEVPFYSSDIEIKATYNLPGSLAKPLVVIGGLRRGEADITEATLDRETGLYFAQSEKQRQIHALVPVMESGKHEIKMKFRLLGTQRLHFLPVANQTNVTMTSNWPHPNFSGAMLPSERSVNKDGFKATWGYQSQDPSMMGPELDQNEYEISLKPDEDVQSFGVDFFVPVDLYTQIERAVKYSMLFIALTFLTFFIFEVVAGLQIHPVQYLFVGLALSLFFLLLLSMAEHIGFGKAYVLASTADIALIAIYTLKILKSKIRSGILLAILAGLYAFLYVILQLEMYSLLAGSIGLFVILALVMYATRNIDWYARDIKAT